MRSLVLCLLVLLLGADVSLAARARQPKRQGLAARAAAYDPATDRYTGQRPATDPWLGALAQAGREFWASRGVQLPEHVALDIADDLGGPDTDGIPGVSRPIGRAWAPSAGRDPRVALDTRFVANRLRLARSGKPARVRRAALKELAGRLLHEQGHVGGLPHVDGDEAGFMGATGAGDVVPQSVARAVRRLVPRRPGEKAGLRNYGIG